MTSIAHLIKHQNGYDTHEMATSFAYQDKQADSATTFPQKHVHFNSIPKSRSRHDATPHTKTLAFYHKQRNYLLTLLNDSNYIANSILSNFYNSSTRSYTLLRPILSIQKKEQEKQNTQLRLTSAQENHSGMRDQCLGNYFRRENSKVSHHQMRW